MIKYVPFDIYNFEHKKYYDLLRITTVSDLRGIVAEVGRKPVGMVLLDTWTENSCQAHIKIDTPMCLRPGGLITQTVHYVFDYCQRQIIFGLLRSDNLKAIAFDKRIGFKHEATIKDAYAVGVDSVVLAMTPTDCKYYIPHMEAA